MRTKKTDFITWLILSINLCLMLFVGTLIGVLPVGSFVTLLGVFIFFLIKNTRGYLK